MRKTGLLTCALLVAAGVAVAQEKTGDVAKGKEIFEQCSGCHSVDTDEKKMGPSLKGLFKKEKMSSGKPVSEENVKAIIDKGNVEKGMPAYEEMLSEEERVHVLAYVKSL
jgi:cytochrome c2